MVQASVLYLRYSRECKKITTEILLFSRTLNLLAPIFYEKEKSKQKRGFSMSKLDSIGYKDEFLDETFIDKEDFSYYEY